MTRHAARSADRPLCPRCSLRRVYRGGYLCTACSHDKPARERVNRPPESELVETGLRLDLDRGELIDAAGIRTPAPPGLPLRYFFGKRSPAGIVPLLRPSGKRSAQ